MSTCTLRLWVWLLIVASLLRGAGASSVAPNRFANLEQDDPFYPSGTFARLVTPQWVGEPGVEAVVILAIDDMRETKKYEAFLRPILERLKKIDGRAPVSIMTCVAQPDDPQLAAWLKEGLSIDVHTLAHPCPLLQKGNFDAAAQTVHRCVELLNQIPGNHATAYRMPCCDSMNSPSPRFFAEIFNGISSNGQFLTISSSVMNLFTTNDPALPRELVLDAQGRERFRKYFPAETNAVTKKSLAQFATWIENYPYPYVIGKLCWEFPGMVPSDWEAFNLHGATNAVTLGDWKAALDLTVLKQGTFNFIFHPHGWSAPQQFVEFIDYAVGRYGKRVKFLNFREAQERLDKNLLLGNPLRATNGRDNGVRLLDLNGDGFMDVVIGNERARITRVWNPAKKAWIDTSFPTQITDATIGTGVRFGVVSSNGPVCALVRSETRQGAWSFDGKSWVEDKTLLRGLELSGQPVLTSKEGRDRGVRFRDVNNDSRDELIAANESQHAVFEWSAAERAWKKLDYSLPKGAAFVDANGRDAGLRFVDLNGDGFDDVVFSNEKAFGVYTFVPVEKKNVDWRLGWSQELRAGNRGDPGEIPMISRGGEHPNNGAWFKHGAMWVQNEDTAAKPFVVERIPLDQLLAIPAPAPKSPQGSLACIKVRDGFKVELVAAEPLTRDPIGFEWDARGRLWVVEMGDYPLGVDGKGKSGGVVRILEDTDGDGVYDKSTVFLDGLNYPTGVTPWRNGVLIAAAPEIFYAEDTDGDGRADVRRVLFTGFREGNQQHRLNGFDFGLDGWFYGANGDSGGVITSVLTGKRVDINGRDFRFKPDTGEFELEPGRTQYGRHRDNWGNWFGVNNSTWGWHYYLPERYLARNPNLAVKENRHSYADYPDNKRCYPISQGMRRFNWPDAVNTVTSGCGVMPYRDELFGPDFATSLFICEPVNNLVHREVLEPDGVSFHSHRAKGEETSEFFASTDTWSRPVYAKTGPDGALYIADMYRLVIEHPEWIPAEAQKRIDLRAGEDKGRIYRVAPVNEARRKIPNLANLKPAELVAAMDSPSGWQRDTVQRLIIERASEAEADALQTLAEKSAHAVTRLQALWTLEALELLRMEFLSRKLTDDNAAVREGAALIAGDRFHRLHDEGVVNVVMSGDSIRQIAALYGLTAERIRTANQLKNDQLKVGQLLKIPGEKTDGPSFDRARQQDRLWVRTSWLKELRSTLLALKDDPNVRVRYQAAFAMGELFGGLLPTHELADIARRDAREEAIQIAVLSSVPGSLKATMKAVLDDSGSTPSSLLEQLVVLALDEPDVLAGALTRIAAPHEERYANWQFDAVGGLLDALERRKSSLAKFSVKTDPGLNVAIEKLNPLFADARRLVDAGTADASALRLLGRGPTDQTQDFERLGRLLGPRFPAAIQQAALAGLARGSGEAVAKILLGGWKSFSPSLRGDVVATLMRRQESILALLGAVERGEVAASQISTSQRQKLLAHTTSAVRERAERVFGAINADRAKVVKSFDTANDLVGVASRGAAVYGASCAQCHKLRGEGNEVGPDLGSVVDKTIPQLIEAIFDPNRAVESRYLSYTAVTTAGREVSGIITAETPNSLTLKLPGGVEETVLRSDLQSLTGSGLSLMPEGLESAMKPQDVADLIAFIKSGAVAAQR